MVCPYCAHSTSVVNSRHQHRLNQVWRRRQCNECRAIFTTHELTDASQALAVRDTMGHLQPFLRDKLFLSIHDSLKHRKTATADAAALTATIINQLYTIAHEARLEAAEIIDLSAATLERFDAVAAAHYRAFHP